MNEIQNLLYLKNIPEELHFQIIIYSNMKTIHTNHIKELTSMYNIYNSYGINKNKKSFIEYLNTTFYIDRWKSYRKPRNTKQTTFLNII